MLTQAPLLYSHTSSMLANALLLWVFKTKKQQQNLSLETPMCSLHPFILAKALFLCASIVNFNQLAAYFKKSFKFCSSELSKERCSCNVVAILMPT